MTISAIVAMVVLGFNLGLSLMPFLLSWSLTLNVSTFFLLVANVLLFSPLNPLQFFASWGASLLGTIQSCIFLRSTINPSRMLTFWHYDSEPLHGHLKNQYFEIAARGFVACVYILEGILFVIPDIRTVAYLAIRLSVNVVILVGLFIYFQIVFCRPTVAQFYLAMILTSCFADVAIIIVASTAGEDASGMILLAFFGVQLIAAVVTMLVTAIYGSAYNRFRVQGSEHSGSERLYPIFHDHQLYAPSLWLYMPAWFRSSPHPIEYTEDPRTGSKASLASKAYSEPGEEDESYASLYDVSAIESELDQISTSEQSTRPSTPPVSASELSPTPSLQVDPQPRPHIPRRPHRTIRFNSRYVTRGRNK